MGMLKWDWTFAISLFSNTSVTVFVFLLAVSAIRLLSLNWSRLTKISKIGLTSIILLAVFFVVRVGFWSPTMWLSDVGGPDRYHEGLIDFRWISYIPASLFGLAGLAVLAVSLLQWSLRKVLLTLTVSVLIGVAVGLSWQMSEHDYWFDRQKVIKVFDEWTGLGRER